MRTSRLARALQLLPGETPALVRVAAIGAAYSAGTALGETISEAVFVARVGAEALPQLFLLKGVIDVVTAACYVPLARDRSPAAVLRFTLSIYIVAVAAGRLGLAADGIASAYGLYVAHETAWTLITIQWGVFVLDVFDASQARRLLPLLFTSSQLGAIGAGAALFGLASPLGAIDLLWAAAGLGGLALGLCSLARGRPVAAPSSSPRLVPPHAAPADGDPPAGDAPARSTPAAWRAALASPLVRATAASTALMVLVRYSLRQVSLATIAAHFGGHEDQIATFLGGFTAVAGGLGVALGALAVPALIAAVGVRVANLLYAGATAAAFAALIAAPSLAAAAVARFVYQQLKDALKTPLSALFYGAEPPPLRAPARAFVFGVAIPAATVATALALQAAPLAVTSWLGLGASAAFLASCSVQNRTWRQRLAALLTHKLARVPAAPPEREAAVREVLGRLAPDLARDAELSRGLASADARARAVAEELLRDRSAGHAADAVVGELRRLLSRIPDG
jgi:hypothetical protein